EPARLSQDRGARLHRQRQRVRQPNQGARQLPAQDPRQPRRRGRGGADRRSGLLPGLLLPHGQEPVPAEGEAVDPTRRHGAAEPVSVSPRLRVKRVMRAALPDYLPIVAERLRRGDYRPVYTEHEIDAPLDLCDGHGRVSPAAVGWSRRPLVRANISGHWLRKKRWNFWNWIGPRCVFSVTMADIDYAACCQVSFIDFETRRSTGATAIARPGSLALP